LRKLYLTFTCAAIISSVTSSCANKTSEDQLKTDQTTQADRARSALPLGVEVPNLVYADDVRKYMKDVLAAPLPVNYVLPEDVRNAGDYGLSVSKVNEHFPEFLYKEGDEMLKAVKENPVRFQEYMLEARANREFYYPGSQTKSAQ
jgi:hypothetical protein